MFRAVDACDWEVLRGLYSTSCVYERPGFSVIEGLDALTDFYAAVRPIISGQHTITLMVEDSPYLCAAGDFAGVLRSGANIRLRFADIYLFSGHLIRRRTTFFFTPLA
jgi:hypothetical protein